MTPLARWQTYVARDRRVVVGLMSGTSVDGIDVAAVEVGPAVSGCAVLAFETVAWPPEERAALLTASAGNADPERVARLHLLVGRRFGDAAAGLAERLGVRPDAVGSHGQTIAHVPSAAGALPAATLQIGAAPPIAQRTGAIVVSDFRTADLALGGQGAPLVPAVDALLHRHPTESRALQNVGGIGNVTYLPAGSDAVVGFDTGPGNLLIDLAASWASGGVEAMDTDGRRARRGRVDREVLERLRSHPALAVPPPRSFGREEFGDALFREILAWRDWSGAGDDLCATLTAFTAASIADAYRRHLPQFPDRVWVAGGGARNPALMDALAAALAPARVGTQAELGIDPDAKEAVAFAVLADALLCGREMGLPSVTGSSRPSLLGSVTFP